MKISLLITSFNSISQMSYTKLKDLGHSIDITYAINDIQMIKEIIQFSPDIIICPFLKKFIPKEIYTLYPTFIIHPGIIGDKGAYSLDNVINNEVKKWGVVILKANHNFDSGDIYSEVKFTNRDTYKASLYRNETLRASAVAIDELLLNFQNKTFLPKKQPSTPMHKTITQKDRKINWQNDNTSQIIKKINMSDSYPGVLDNILGIDCYLYGVHKEEKLKGNPKDIIVKRDGAICIGTIDGAIWISHLKEVDSFKLPATYVLKDKLKGIKENRLPLIFDKSYKTFYEISCEIKNDIGYLYFNFHNGAFGANQCIKLKYAIEYLKENVKVLVLCGGQDFFSNGIHLNILEDSAKNGEDGWSNINAMNDLVKSVLFCENIITIASINKNAGAGGVFLALACDKVIASEDIVLNPHYKTLGLSGSEYHTYTLPKRVGSVQAQKLLDDCLPISSTKALQIGMVDKVFKYQNYQKKLEEFCETLIIDEDKYDDFIWKKEDYLEANQRIINSHKEKEIAIMHPEFWQEESIFHNLRYEFVYKICPTKTPQRLKSRGDENA